MTYRHFHIYYEPNVVGADWHCYHDDYDGAPDSNDDRHTSERTFNEITHWIDNWYFSQEPTLVGYLMGLMDFVLGTEQVPQTVKDVIRTNYTYKLCQDYCDSERGTNEAFKQRREAQLEIEKEVDNG
jgi:hypothetical protein